MFTILDRGLGLDFRKQVSNLLDHSWIAVKQFPLWDDRPSYRGYRFLSVKREAS
ncbi:hypothetical protein [Leptolyngbya sp. FACHB-711]|uniref:hypothetical protein n=1 Tax=unclassified Leptolyngbya TaxID=2650499 RepID=UPI00168493CB|nr:hypothetical protein [Leptolyngbya sp. FACHB-711]MBD1850838.1 hypothetical protein [Cyanobacteria bacterium FACHB-502]MBD2027678.1 hypothetical protein [Leptolyngbya sp. FACHB-711]